MRRQADLHDPGVHGEEVPHRLGAAVTRASGPLDSVRAVLARPCRVRAVIERPPAPPWIGALPESDGSDWWTGTLRAWCWVEAGLRTWTGLVDYSRDGLLYSHWVDGDLVDVQSDDDLTSCTIGSLP